MQKKQDQVQKNTGRRRLQLTADQLRNFGFSKLIIAIANSGKLIALHAETGELAWSRFVHPGRGARDSSGSHQVYVLRQSNAGPNMRPELLVVHHGAAGGALSRATWIDAATGQDSRPATDLGYSVAHAMLLPASATPPALGSTRILVALDAGLNVHVLPDVASARAQVASLHRSLFVRHFDAASNTLQGFALADEGRHAVVRWSLAVPHDARLVGWASVPSVETVASPVHEQGNDGLLVKYLNPHLIAAAALQQHEDSSTLLVYLVDSVTGHIVRQYKHKDAAEPVHLIRSENWAFATYWNTVARRTEISSVALYEGEVEPDELNPWSSIPDALQPDTADEAEVSAMHEAAERIALSHTLADDSDDSAARAEFREGATPFSSFSASDPVALQKTFVFPTGIRALTSTQSKRGITNKHLLVGLLSEQLLLLDRRMLDPRRPKDKPTPSDAKEGLFQYSPIVHFSHAAVVSYTQRVPRLNLIHSAPAELESTTLVIGCGLDMFYARSNPSRGFDLMPDDFSYAQLMLICGGLLGGVLYARRALKRKKMAQMWA